MTPSKLEDELYAKYTDDRPVVVEGEPDARTVWLVVEQQSFRLNDYWENASHAKWMRRNLAKALVKIVGNSTAARGTTRERG